jgi:ABC-2 type transport system permease protein
VLNTLHSEWGKTWSVRAPLACLIATVALVLVTGASLANDTLVSISSGELPGDTTVPAIDSVGSGIQFGQLAFAAFALQLITAEYATGVIRSTLQAQPRRHLVLLAKALIAAAVGAVTGSTLGAVAGVCSEAILGAHLAEGRTVTQMSVTSGCMLAVVGVLVVGLGAALRSAVGTLALSSAVLLGSLALPDSVGRWAPGQAGAALLEGSGEYYGSAVALAVLGSWAAVCLGSGMWLLERRDA